MVINSIDHQPDVQNNALTAVAIKVYETKFNDLTTQIKDKPNTLDDVKTKDLEAFKPYLALNKDKATELLLTTLDALKADTKGVRRGDRKTLENIKTMIIDNKYSSVEEVGAQQLETDVFNDTFTNTSLETYGKLFDDATKSTTNWFKNIGATYTEGAYKAFDDQFKKEFADKYFTPAQFQKELYTKNEARMGKLVTALTSFCIGDFMTENKYTDISVLEKGSCNIWKDKNISADYTANNSSSAYWEYEYLIQKNPSILTEWKGQIQSEKDVATAYQKQETETLLSGFTQEVILATYLSNNSNKKDAIYNFNNNATYSKLGEIVTSLNDAVTTYPTNTELTGLITSLKAGKFEDVQTIIYTGYTSTLKKTIDGKFGNDTKKALDAYLLKLQPAVSVVKNNTPINNTDIVTETIDPMLTVFDYGFVIGNLNSKDMTLVNGTKLEKNPTTGQNGYARDIESSTDGIIGKLRFDDKGALTTKEITLNNIIYTVTTKDNEIALTKANETALFWGDSDAGDKILANNIPKEEAYVPTAADLIQGSILDYSLDTENIGDITLDNSVSNLEENPATKINGYVRNIISSTDEDHTVLGTIRFDETGALTTKEITLNKITYTLTATADKDIAFTRTTDIDQNIAKN